MARFMIDSMVWYFSTGAHLFHSELPHSQVFKGLMTERNTSTQYLVAIKGVFQVSVGDCVFHVTERGFDTF